MTRFQRTALLLGDEAMERLKRAHVTVVGLGAVGSFAIEALARSGIGHLRLVDFDDVQPSNLNRQLYALESTVTRSKVDVAVERVRDINPDCHVEGLPVFVRRDTASRVIARPVDCVVDAIDSLGPKIELLVACAESGTPVVSSMGAARRTDPLALRVADVFDSHTCPLARFVRKRLRRRGISGGTIRCVFSTEPAAEDSLGEAEQEAEPWQSPELGNARQPLGSLASVTGTIGLVAAREVLATLVELPPPSCIKPVSDP